jgi:hypothetical protein
MEPARTIRTYAYVHHDGETRESKHNLTDVELKEARAVCKNAGALMVPIINGVRAVWPSGVVRGVIQIEQYWFAMWFDSTSKMYLGIDEWGMRCCATSERQARQACRYDLNLRRILRQTLNHE